MMFRSWERIEGRIGRERHEAAIRRRGAVRGLRREVVIAILRANVLRSDEVRVGRRSEEIQQRGGKGDPCEEFFRFGGGLDVVGRIRLRDPRVVVWSRRQNYTGRLYRFPVSW
jgi:hypothetical protein